MHAKRGASPLKVVGRIPQHEKFFGICTYKCIFSSNYNIHKCSSGLCFWASDPLIEKF